MKQTTIEISSVFPAPAPEVWRRLGRIETLQTIARPYAAFTPMKRYGAWQAGETYHMRLRLFGMIPLGIHTIFVVRWDETAFSILTREGNPFVPIWNHEIELLPLGDTCRYTDRVTLGAGWKTPLVCLWSLAFYRHRQRAWRNLLKKEGFS